MPLVTCMQLPVKHAMRWPVCCVSELLLWQYKFSQGVLDAWQSQAASTHDAFQASANGSQLQHNTCKGGHNG